MTDTSTTASSAPIDYGTLVNKANGSSDIGAMTGLIKSELSTQAAKDKDPNIIATRERGLERLQADEKRVDAAFQGIEPLGDRVKPWDAKKEAAERTTDPFQSFGSAGAIFALIASAFTHTPAINAMNGMASAINAVKANDRQGYEDAYNAWKENTTLALDRHRAEMEDFNSAMEKAKNDPAVMAQELQVYGAKYDDKIAMAHAALGDFGTLQQAKTAQQNASMRWVELQPQIQAMHDQQMERFSVQDQLMNDFGKTPTGQEWAKTNTDPKTGKVVVPPALQASAALAVKRENAIAERAGTDSPENKWELYVDSDPNHTPYRYQASTGKATTLDASAQYHPTGATKAGTGARSVAVQELNDWRASHPGYTDQDEIDHMNEVAGSKIAATAAPKALGTALTKLVTQKAAIDAFEKTAIANGDVLVNLARKVDQTGVPVVERWTRAGRREIGGDTDVTNFNLQAFLYKAEVTRILTNPNLTGVLSDSARAEADDFINDRATAGQIFELHSLLKGDFARRAQSIDSEINGVKDELRSTVTNSRVPGAGSAPVPSGAAAHPPVPASVPMDKSPQWSPSEKKFYWKDDADNWQSAAP